MAPTLQDGDTVLVDIRKDLRRTRRAFSCCRVMHDGVGLVAKRLKHVPGSDPARVRIISDYKFYSPYKGVAGEINKREAKPRAPTHLCDPFRASRT